MPSTELDNLVRIGRLKREPPSAREQQGLLDSARARLVDSGLAGLSFDSRFDLAYNASHSLALYALRRLGYRSDHRYLAFQTRSQRELAQILLRQRRIMRLVERREAGVTARAFASCASQIVC